LTRTSSGNEQRADPPTRFWQKISLMAEISALCRHQRPDGSTFADVLTLIQHMVPFDDASLYLLNPHTRQLDLRACLGEVIAPPSFLTRRPGDALEPWLPSTRKPVLMTDIADEVGFDAATPHSAVMAVPLFVEDEALGMMILGGYARRSLNNKHVKLLTIVADQFAVAVERLNYIGKIEDANRALQEAHEALKGAQERLVANEKLQAVAQLAASMNHEINNPLAVIVGNTQCLMLETGGDAEKTLLRLKRIEEAALRIGDINRKLLKIDSIKTDEYLDQESIRMLNLEKSTSV